MKNTLPFYKNMKKIAVVLKLKKRVLKKRG